MIKAYLRDEVTVVRHGAADAYNEPGAATDEAARGFVEWVQRSIKDAKGETIAATGRVLMLLDRTLTHRDRIRVRGVEYEVVAIEELRDLSTRGMWVYLR